MRPASVPCLGVDGVEGRVAKAGWMDTGGRKGCARHLPHRQDHVAAFIPLRNLLGPQDLQHKNESQGQLQGSCWLWRAALVAWVNILGPGMIREGRQESGSVLVLACPD